MLGQKQPDDSPITLVAPSGGVTSGVPILIGGLVVIPAANAAEGERFSGYTRGVYTLAKATGTGALGQGALVDWDPTPGNVVAAGAVQDNYPIGHLVKAAGDSATECEVRLTGNDTTAHP